MQDYLYLGESPSNEDCAQVGSMHYSAQAKAELRLLIQGLRKKFGKEPQGARLHIRNEHGEYYSLVCDYDDTYPKSFQYASKLEGEWPETWAELGLLRPTYQPKDSFESWYMKLKVLFLSQFSLGLDDLADQDYHGLHQLGLTPEEAVSLVFKEAEEDI